MSVHHRRVILSLHHSKCKLFKCRTTGSRIWHASVAVFFASVIWVMLQSSCRFCIVLMLCLHCICVGMGSINVVPYISVLKKEGNISVIYNSERRCFISKKPLFPFLLQILFSTVTKACFKLRYKASSPVCWKVITYMQTMNVLLHAFFYCFFLYAPERSVSNQRWALGRTFVQD